MYFKRHYSKIVAAVDSQLRELPTRQTGSGNHIRLCAPLTSHGSVRELSVDGGSLDIAESKEARLAEHDDATEIDDMEG